MQSIPKDFVVFILRHGYAKSNMQGILVSGDECLADFGLVDEGERQCYESAQRFYKEYSKLFVQGYNVEMIVSDFLRTKQTAQIFANNMKKLTSSNNPELKNFSISITYESRLRERYFGDFNLKDCHNYSVISDLDRKDPTVSVNKAESATDLCNRLGEAFTSTLRKATPGKKILIFVSHESPLCALQCFLRGNDPRNLSLEMSLKNAQYLRISPPVLFETVVKVSSDVLKVSSDGSEKWKKARGDGREHTNYSAN